MTPRSPLIFTDLLAPYIEQARRVNGGKPSRGRRSEGQRRSPTELHAIRQ